MVYNDKRNDLFDNTLLAPPNDFSKNPLIHKLKDDKKWTISSNKKEPTDMYALLHLQQWKPAYLVDKTITDTDYPLTTLTTIDKQPELQNTNRCYRLSALENRCIMIDIEPKSSDSLLLFWAKFPAHYKEISKNGGIHLLIEIPEELINDENEYIINSLTQIKDGKNGEIEYLFNRHYITFTRRMPKQMEIADFKNNPHHKEQLKQLLNRFVELDREKKAIRESIKNQIIEYNANSKQIESINNQLQSESNGINNILYNITLGNESFMETCKTLGQNAKDQSPSTKEFYTGNYILHTIIKNVGYMLMNAKQLNYQLQQVIDWTETDYIYMTYLYLKEILEYREKHDEFRNGMPWLLFIANNSYKSVKGQHYLSKVENKQEKDSKLYDKFYSHTTSKTSNDI